MVVCPVEDMNLKRRVRQFLPSGGDRVFQQMGGKEEYINGDIKRDSIWKIRKRNRILMGCVNIPTYYHLERRLLNNIELAILKQGRLRGPGPGAPPPAWDIQENLGQLLEL